MADTVQNGKGSDRRKEDRDRVTENLGKIPGMYVPPWKKRLMEKEKQNGKTGSV